MRFICLLLTKLVLIPIGLAAVAVGIPFRRIVLNGDRPIVRLPQWLLWFDNAYDGLTGDKRDDWNRFCLERYGKPASHPLCMWLWAAVRNPVNYWSRNIAGVDVSRLFIRLAAGREVVIEEPGKSGWQLIRALRDDGSFFFRLFGSFAYPFRHDRGLMFDFGWKLKLSHSGMPKDAQENDRFKGIVFVVSPWKVLE